MLLLLVFPYPLFLFVPLVSFWHCTIVVICEDDFSLKYHKICLWMINYSRRWLGSLLYLSFTLCFWPYFCKIVSHHLFYYSILMYLKGMSVEKSLTSMVYRMKTLAFYKPGNLGIYIWYLQLNICWYFIDTITKANINSINNPLLKK